MAIELVGFDQLKLMLELEKTESDYPTLTLIQESVVAAFESYLGRNLSEDKYEESNFVYFPQDIMPLKALPVKSITSAAIDGVEITDYKIRDFGILLGSKVEGVEVVVSYVGGLTSVPDDISRAALLQTSYEYQTHDHIGAETVATEGGMVTTPSLSLLKEVVRLLKNHRHPVNKVL